MRNWHHVVTAAVACYVDPLSQTALHLHFFEIAIQGKDTKGNDVPLYGELAGRASRQIELSSSCRATFCSTFHRIRSHRKKSSR